MIPSRIQPSILFSYFRSFSPRTLSWLLNLWLLLTLRIPHAGAETKLETQDNQATAQDNQSQQELSQQVQTILTARCFSCHGPDVSEGGLRFDSQAAALSELDSGNFAIVPQQPAQSALLARITSSDPEVRMPPEGKPLREHEVALFREWITAGAHWKTHWAFEPVQPQQPPKVNTPSWVRNEIDAFILAKLEAQGLFPAPPAEKQVLARRVYYDVTGLPPTPEQLEHFLLDKRPDAYACLVDQLLASPAYGEKWARHWLDVVRYAETNSFERDAVKPYAWKYRDYVIRSLNDDKPYDQFVMEQLAGDELDEITADSITATGYYRLGTWDDEPADELQATYDDLDNILNTTGQGFLGLTVGCARCHDHKIDPIPQTNYYQLLSFFADLTPYARPHQRDPAINSLTDLSPPAIQQARSVLQNEIRQLQEQKKPIEQAAIQNMTATDQRRSETAERQKLLDEKLDQFIDPSAKNSYQTLVNQLAVAKARLAELPQKNLVLSLGKCIPHPKTTHVMMRGNPHVLGEPVAPDFPDLFAESTPELPTAAPQARSAGRRRILAQWIASSNNRLTARVITNRIWQHHFGRGIVRSANNFGQLGTPPTHAELLDWMAHWLTQHGWRLKSLHRLMLLSNTYQMASRANPAATMLDPENNLFWRFNPRRLMAEEIRDTLLFVSGQLNHQLYGPSIYPKLSQEVLQTQSQPGNGWPTSQPQAATRRSIYIHIKRSLIPPELSAFDFPDTDTSCEARFNTTLPSQSLNLLHSEFLQTQAGHLADRVRQAAEKNLSARVELALQLALGHPADTNSIADGLSLIGRLENIHGVESAEAFRQFCVLVLNLNEFVYLD